MKNRKPLALVFMVSAIGLGVAFYTTAGLPDDLGGYFKLEYYNRFGPIAICIELFIAGLYLFRGSPKANFALALFAFTALLDPLFDLVGIFNSLVPCYAAIFFIICALPALWLAFSNAFKLGRISIFAALGSFLLGCAVELFFNYLV